MGQGKPKRRINNRLTRVIAVSISALAIVLATVAVLLLPNGNAATDIGNSDSLPQRVAETEASPIAQDNASETAADEKPGAGNTSQTGNPDNESAGTESSVTESADAPSGQSAPGPDGSPSANTPSSTQLASQIPSVEEIPRDSVSAIELEHESDVVLAQIPPAPRSTMSTQRSRRRTASSRSRQPLKTWPVVM